jgi:hypothetical protein
MRSQSFGSTGPDTVLRGKRDLREIVFFDADGDAHTRPPRAIAPSRRPAPAAEDEDPKIEGKRGRDVRDRSRPAEEPSNAADAGVARGQTVPTLAPIEGLGPGTMRRTKEDPWNPF